MEKNNDPAYQRNVGESIVTDHDITLSTSDSKGDKILFLDTKNDKNLLRECTHNNNKKTDDDMKKRKMNLNQKRKVDVYNDNAPLKDDAKVDTKTFEDWKSTGDNFNPGDYEIEDKKNLVVENSHDDKNDKTKSINYQATTEGKTASCGNQDCSQTTLTEKQKEVKEESCETDEDTMAVNDVCSNDPLIDVEQEVQEICGVARSSSSKASDRVKLRCKVGEVFILLSLDTLADCRK